MILRARTFLSAQVLQSGATAQRAGIEVKDVSATFLHTQHFEHPVLIKRAV
jgi:hypothetical protein